MTIIDAFISLVIVIILLIVVIFIFGPGILGYVLGGILVLVALPLLVGIVIMIVKKDY